MMQCNKYFFTTFLTFSFLEIISLISYIYPQITNIAFILISTIFLLIALYNLPLGLYMMIGELMIGGKGYLFSLNYHNNIISIRISFFLIILSIWLYQIIKKRALLSQLKLKSYSILKYYYLLFVFIGIGFISGILRNNFDVFFFDFNSWIFFIMVFVFTIFFQIKDFVKPLFIILLSSSLWLSLKTIIILYLFSHDFFYIGDIFYKWVRDSGVGEITYIHGNLFRIFFQSHIYLLVTILIIYSLLLVGYRLKFFQALLFGITLYASLLSIIISQSRSFWIAFIVSLIVLIPIYIYNFKIKPVIILFVTILFIVILSSQFSILKLITGDIYGNAIAKRITEYGSEAAGISRKNQIIPLLNAIKKNPILGSGFGTTVTYKSLDPRIIKNHPDGWYTTYAFEWGYLDIALKIGVTGLIFYLILIFKTIKEGIFKIQNEFKYVSRRPFLGFYLGIFGGMIAFVITNIFTPYLNHPLGIAYIIIASLLLTSIPTKSYFQN